MPTPPFRCKKFLVNQEGAAHPVGTDSILLGSWANVQGVTKVLDIGTGTGILSIMLAQRLSELHSDFEISGVEIHTSSAICAQNNFNQSPWKRHFALEPCAIQTFSPGYQFDLIVSNPPFFTETIVAPDESRRHARNTDTLPIGDLCSSITRLLSAKGICCMIMPVLEGKRLYQYAALHGLYVTKISAVNTLPGKKTERLLLQLEKNPYPFERSCIQMFQSHNQPTELYQKLTGDFYLGY